MDNEQYLHVHSLENVDDRLRGGCCSGNTSQSRLDDNGSDKYTAAIELSNKCREFYKSRVQDIKSRWTDNNVRQHDSFADSNTSFSSSNSSSQSDISDNEKTTKSKQERHRVDQAMEKLRTEMVSLMDQDLSLMKQLLTLNEIIEELKWQRQHYTYSTSWTSFSASNNLDSNLSLSDTEMYESEDHVVPGQQTSSNSIQTARVMEPNWYKPGNIRRNSRDVHTISVDSDNVNAENGKSFPANKSVTNSSTRMKYLPGYSDKSASVFAAGSKFNPDHHVISNGPITSHRERDEDSFDSGIHEVLSGDELTWSN